MFTEDEFMLLTLYGARTRAATISAIREVRSCLEVDEVFLRELTESVLAKLARMSDSDFMKLDL